LANARPTCSRPGQTIPDSNGAGLDSRIRLRAGGGNDPGGSAVATAVTRSPVTRRVGAGPAVVGAVGVVTAAVVATVVVGVVVGTVVVDRRRALRARTRRRARTCVH